MAVIAWEQLASLLRTPTLPDLGPGPRAGVEPEPKLSARLTALLDETKLAPRQAALVRALVLLWHDHLDAAHTLAQEIENSDGSFVHGIMHRREPDFGNARYWFRHVGAHPTFPEIAAQVQQLLKSGGAHSQLRELATAEHWDPFAFIDACQKARAGSRETETLKQIQQIESEVLLKRFAGS